MRTIVQTVIVANSQWLMDYSADGFKPLDTTTDGQIVVYRKLRLGELIIIKNDSFQHEDTRHTPDECRLIRNSKERPLKIVVGSDYPNTSSENTFFSQYFAIAILEGQDIWQPVLWQRDLAGTWSKVRPHELTESNRLIVIRWFIVKGLYKKYSEYQQRMKDKEK